MYSELDNYRNYPTYPGALPHIRTMAKRVFVSVSSRSPLFHAAWKDPQSVMQGALDLIIQQGLNPTDTSPRLLAVERWNRIHLVFDLGHNTYEPETEHLPGQNDLVVLAVYLGGNGHVSTQAVTAASTSLQDEVNKQIRELHDWTGIGSQPPFIIDHANGEVPNFPHPRTLKKA